MTKYINGTQFKPASEVAQEVEPVDIVSQLSLDLANGAKLSAVLRRYAWYLAAKLDEEADAYAALIRGTAQHVPETDVHVEALRQAAGSIRQEGGR